MIQKIGSGCSKETWKNFLSKIRSTSPVSSEKIKKFIKFKQRQFPTDLIIVDYYESIFSKITCAANRTKWHQMDKYLLIWCVVKVLKLRGKKQLIPEQQDWEYISQILQVNQQLLEIKWLQMLHSNLQIKKWSSQEDEQLVFICNEFLQTNNWTEIAIKFNSVSKTQRYPKQIRERYNNVLNPSLHKTQWTEKENQLLIELVKEHGKKWSKLSLHFNGKSENQLKVRFQNLSKSLKKQKKFKKMIQNTHFVDDEKSENEIVESDELQEQQVETDRKLEQSQLLQTQNNLDQVEKIVRPMYLNYSNQMLYTQQMQRQQFYQTNYPRYYQYNYSPYSNGNYQFLNYYQY